MIAGPALRDASRWRVQGARWTRAARSVGVARRHLAGDLRTFLEVAANDQVGRRCAGAIALLVAAIAAIEAGDHTHAPVAARGLGVDERLHFVAPFLARSEEHTSELQSLR